MRGLSALIEQYHDDPDSVQGYDVRSLLTLLSPPINSSCIVVVNSSCIIVFYLHERVYIHIHWKRYGFHWHWKYV